MLANKKFSKKIANYSKSVLLDFLSYEEKINCFYTCKFFRSTEKNCFMYKGFLKKIKYLKKYFEIKSITDHLEQDILDLPYKNAYYNQAIEFDLYYEFLKTTFDKENANLNLKEENFEALRFIFEYGYFNHGLKYVILEKLNEDVFHFITNYKLRYNKFMVKLGPNLLFLNEKFYEIPNRVDKDLIFTSHKVIDQFYKAKEEFYEKKIQNNQLDNQKEKNQKIEYLINAVKIIGKINVSWVVEKGICDNLLQILMDRDIFLKIENYFADETLPNINDNPIIKYCTKFNNSLKNLNFYCKKINFFENFNNYNFFTFTNQEEKIKYFEYLFQFLQKIFELNSKSIKSVRFYTNEIFSCNRISELLDLFLILDEFKHKSDQIKNFGEIAHLYENEDKPKSTFIIEFSGKRNKSFISFFKIKNNFYDDSEGRILEYLPKNINNIGFTFDKNLTFFEKIKETKNFIDLTYKTTFSNRSLDVNTANFLQNKEKIFFLKTFYDKIIEINDDIISIIKSFDGSIKNNRWLKSSIIGSPYRISEYFQYLKIIKREYLINKYDKIFFSTFALSNKPFTGEDYIDKEHFLYEDKDISIFDDIHHLKFLEYIIEDENSQMDVLGYFRNLKTVSMLLITVQNYDLFFKNFENKYSNIRIECLFISFRNLSIKDISKFHSSIMRMNKKIDIVIDQDFEKDHYRKLLDIFKSPHIFDKNLICLSNTILEI